MSKRFQTYSIRVVVPGAEYESDKFKELTTIFNTCGLYQDVDYDKSLFEANEAEKLTGIQCYLFIEHLRQKFSWLDAFVDDIQIVSQGGFKGDQFVYVDYSSVYNRTGFYPEWYHETETESE